MRPTMRTSSIKMTRWSFIVCSVVLASSCERGPVAHVNPNANQRVTITGDATDLPIPIDSASFAASYTIENASCLKPLPISGAIASPFVSVPITVRKKSTNTFEATVLLDQFKAEDYDGLGDCHWGVAIAGFTLKHGPRELAISMSDFDNHHEGKSTGYFSAWSINNAPTDRPQTGLSNGDAVRISNTERIYSVTLTAKEAIIE